jgi:outer membrane receptor protein involved in Fe transport
MKSFNSNTDLNDICYGGVGNAHTYDNWHDFGSCTQPNAGNVEAQNVISKTIQNGYGGSVQFTDVGDLLGHKNQATFGASVDLSHIGFSQSGLPADLVGYETITNSLTPETQASLKAKTYYYGLYGTNNFALNEQLNMTLSGRYNVAFVDMKGSNNSDGTTNSLDGNHRYSRFNPAIGFNYNPSLLNIGLYGGYNEGMRAPTPIELACADEDHPCSLPTGFNSDPHLKKVVSKTWEGGVRGKVLNNLRWNASVYQTDMANDIQFIAANTAGQGYFDNVGDTKRRGIELGLNGKFDRLTLAANYGYVDATYESSFTMSSVANSSVFSHPGDDNDGQITVKKGNQMPGIAKQTFKLRGLYDVTPSWNVGATLIAASGQYAQGDQNNQDQHGKIPGYAVMNLDSHLALNREWTLFAKVNNLFDKDYATYGVTGQNIYNGEFEQFRTPSAPRAGWLGVTYSFGGTKKTDADKD